MTQVVRTLGLCLLVLLAGARIAIADSCAIGGHNETSENFTPAAGGWAAINMTPGTVPVPPVGTHLLISEVAPRGAGTGSLSDSSEYVEIYNPTTSPVSLDNFFLSDDPHYYFVVNGPYTVADVNDWTVRFPPGLILHPGRTAVVCVTRTGFNGSGATAPAAEYLLEMRNTNGNTSDDMLPYTPNSSLPISGGSFTNPSTTNGEWVVLFCWGNASDLVADVDYASWGANSASNPKLDKTGVAIDGPDGDTVPSVYSPDTPAAGQTNLGTALTKPNTFQRLGAGEIGEAPAGGNGATTVATRITPTLATIEWSNVGAGTVRFHTQWTNTSTSQPSEPTTATLASQEFGAFMPDYGTIGGFSVPPIAPNSFFDVFTDVPTGALPPTAQTILPGGGPTPASPCPPDTIWAGNVHVVWDSLGTPAQIQWHWARVNVAPGKGPTYLHVLTNCAVAAPWVINGLCAGFNATLVNMDLTAAPNPVPAGWQGYVAITSPAGTPFGTVCCFQVVFNCAGAPGVLRICATTCNFAPHAPTLGTIEWSPVGESTRFHLRWENPDATDASEPASGTVASQEFGVFVPDFGTIGGFTVPAIAPESFFDVFFDVPTSSLPPTATKVYPGGGPGAGSPCPRDTIWAGNVHVAWDSLGNPAAINWHHAQVIVAPGGQPTYLHVFTNCATPAAWAIVGLCNGFNATLVNNDLTAAPNPVPAGWVGWVCITSPAGTPFGQVCCFQVVFNCAGAPGVLRICATTCNFGGAHGPTLASVDWKKLASNVRFHLRWTNPDPENPSVEVSGSLDSQPFGVFQPDFGTIGGFTVPPLAPSSFFDVFFEVPLTSLPPEPAKVMPGGGPGIGVPCPDDTLWAGNVHVLWLDPDGPAQVMWHMANVLVNPGGGPTYIHVVTNCAVAAPWVIAGVCNGFSATLVNEDFTAAANPVPANWTGFLVITANAAVPVGTVCCFTVTFTCNGVPGVLRVCATACNWLNLSVPEGGDLHFGIRSVQPNPTHGTTTVTFALPRAGHVRMDLYDMAGKRVRTLLDGELPAGLRSVLWDGRDGGGRALPAGAYFLTLRGEGRTVNHKLVLFR